MFVEVFHTLVSLLGDGLGCDGLLPHVVGTLLEFITGAFLCLPVLGSGSLSSLLRLIILGIDRAGVDAYQFVALVYRVALLDIETHDASRQLAAHAHGVTVGLALNGSVGGMDEQDAHNGDTCHHQRKYCQCCQQRFVLLADHSSLFVFFHIIIEF